MRKEGGGKGKKKKREDGLSWKLKSCPSAKERGRWGERRREKGKETFSSNKERNSCFSRKTHPVWSLQRKKGKKGNHHHCHESQKDLSCHGQGKKGKKGGEKKSLLSAYHMHNG